MNKFKLAAVAGLTAAAIGVGGLIEAPSASARVPRETLSCQQLMDLASFYYEMANVALNVFHNYAQYDLYHTLAENYDTAAYHVC